MKPAQVLDYQATLRDYLRGPAYQRYAESFLEDWRAKNGIRFNGAPGTIGTWWTTQEIARLEAAYAFHVDADMTPLIRHAAASLHGDEEWTRELWPTQAGFLMLDEPLLEREVRGRWSPTHAVSWQFGDDGTGTPCVWVSLYSQWRDPRDEVARADEAAPELRESFRALGDLHLTHIAAIAFGTRVGPQQTPVGEAAAARYAAAGDPLPAGTVTPNFGPLMYALLALMGQTVTDVTDADLSPGVKRVAGKRRVPPRVVVIRLRRTAGSRQDGESNIEWAHRWVVRGHWRSQPCGEGRRERRMVWVAPYVKGPEDRPIVISEKVYDLSR